MTAVTVVIVSLLLGGCDAALERNALASSSFSPSPSPAAGKGSGKSDDINGDGFADLVFTSPYWEAPPDLTIVYGSKDGLTPRNRTVVHAADFGFAHVRSSGTADLDGDGFADVVIGGYPAATHYGTEYVVWGGPKGVDPHARPTAVRAPSGVSDFAFANWHRGVPGDFNGDGNDDLVIPVPNSALNHGNDLAVLYGPFTREGAAHHLVVGRVPVYEEFEYLVAGRIDGHRATDLLTYGDDIYSRNSSWLFEAGPGGLSDRPSGLEKGNAAAFGDFDGDGNSDVVITDDGGRYEEPGFDTEPPKTDGVMTVYYFGGARRSPQVFKKVGYARRAVVGDFDGDKRDDLAIGRGSDSVEVFHGGATGLRRGGKVIRRLGPAKGPDGVKVAPGLRQALPRAAADYDGDGRDELALVWFAPAYQAAWSRSGRSQWWITDGSRDESTFDTDGW
ncbi:hypothetical protein FHS43_002092 [Streptosporangium becharense]|uniref:VCBS repeat-containing protein n=1 Tax=Streptosporangium becharense TaxID=1816182 RepID=A0A7W9IC71_9ACTN|nr:VCBS repeat-containing protein [Streptosporangium becharense]MBB2910829.1 hypothetical protein [Streptosporangium becharense]MBB5817524.1 hypothetical protein [Streptosporangium becharense]